MTSSHSHLSQKPKNAGNHVLLSLATLVRTYAKIQKSLSADIQEGLNGFIEKARTGEDLKPYTSKQINDPSYSDLMFYDWGTYHFHLGKEIDNSGFIRRTNELLFALADWRSTTMYLIDIHPHKDAFTNQDLLRILEENWPEMMDQHAFKDIVKLDHNPSDKEIGKLRKAGINVMVQTPGGRVLTPMGGGITSAGTSARVARDILKMRKIAQKAQDDIIKNRNSIADHFLTLYNKNWDELDIRLVALGANIVVQETRTGQVVAQVRI
jgi:hypothetical protein